MYLKKFNIFLLLMLAIFTSSMANTLVYDMKTRPKAADVFIKIVTDKNTAFVGEALTVSYQLYSRVKIMEPEVTRNVIFTNCYVKAFAAERKIWTEKINGIAYQVLIVQKYVIVPLKAGMLTLPELKLQLSLTLPPVADDFFEQEQIVSRMVETKLTQLSIANLLPIDKTKYFAKAVGSEFKVSESYKADSNVLKVKIIIYGAGNLKSIEPPIPVLQPGFTIFDQQTLFNDTISNNELHGNFEYSYQIISKYKGKFTIKPNELYAFDPKEEKYYLLKTTGYEWNVKIGNLMPITKSIAQSNSRKGIMYNKLDPLLNKNNKLFVKSPWFIVMMVISLLLLTLGKVCSSTLIKRDHFPILYAYKNAHKKAKADLKTLESKITNRDEITFIKALERVFVHYLTARLKINPNKFSLATIVKNQTFISLEESLKNQSVSLLNELQRMRFSESQLIQTNKIDHLQIVKSLILKLQQHT